MSTIRCGLTLPTPCMRSRSKMKAVYFSQLPVEHSVWNWATVYWMLHSRYKLAFECTTMDFGSWSSANVHLYNSSVNSSLIQLWGGFESTRRHNDRLPLQLTKVMSPRSATAAVDPRVCCIVLPLTINHTTCVAHH